MDCGAHCAATQQVFNPKTVESDLRRYRRRGPDPSTRLILEVLKADRRIQPERCIIDHVEEHTVQMVLDHGHWAGMTLYPESKCTGARAADILETFGQERLWMNSACDWGVSVPLAVPYAALDMKKRGQSSEAIDKMIYQNPIRFLSQCPKFKLLKN